MLVNILISETKSYEWEMVLKTYLILLLHVNRVLRKAVNHFQPSVAFHIDPSHLICVANQMTGFYMKCSTGLKWVKEYHTVTRAIIRE